MFLVFSKEKVKTYAISILTVVVLFGIATIFNNNQTKNELETSSTEVEQDEENIENN